VAPTDAARRHRELRATPWNLPRSRRTHCCAQLREADLLTPQPRPRRLFSSSAVTCAVGAWRGPTGGRIIWNGYLTGVAVAWANASRRTLSVDQRCAAHLGAARAPSGAGCGRLAIRTSRPSCCRPSCATTRSIMPACPAGSTVRRESADQGSPYRQAALPQGECRLRRGVVGACPRPAYGSGQAVPLSARPLRAKTPPGTG